MTTPFNSTEGVVSDHFLFLINRPNYVKIRRFLNLSIEGLAQ